MTQAPYDLDALLQGDRAEFEKLVRSESPRLFQVLRRFVRDEDEARSIMQETFMQAYLRLDSFRGEAKITTWLYSIGINQARAYLRKSRRHDSLDEHDVERLQPAFRRGMYVDSYPEWHPDAVASGEERRRIVHAAIDRLPEAYRIVVVLRDLRGFSTDEVADMLETTNGAVRVRLHRARQALRALLDPYFGEST